MTLEDPNRRHSKRCLAAAMICAIENARDERTNDVDFRIAMQNNVPLEWADLYLREGMLDCACPPAIVFHRTRFLEDDIVDGDYPRDDTGSEAWEAQDGDPPDEIVDLACRKLEWEGLSFADTGNDWAVNPDGSRIIDYATGMREEVTAHLYRFTSDQLNEITRRVG